jgi:hypothetical protein
MYQLITATTANEGLWGINTLKGGFLAACLVMAGLLILGQSVVVVIAALRATATPDEASTKLKEAAALLETASKAIQLAAQENKDAATANKEAATTSGASTTAGVHALKFIKDDSAVLNLIQRNLPEANRYLMEVDLNAANAEEKAESATAATEKATEATEEATTKTEEAVETADKASASTFIGALNAVALKNPLVGAALLFTLIGAIGANLIMFSIT